MQEIDVSSSTRTNTQITLHLAPFLDGFTASPLFAADDTTIRVQEIRRSEVDTGPTRGYEAFENRHLSFGRIQTSVENNVWGRGRRPA